jgi:lantibiotic modifying enzyme
MDFLDGAWTVTHRSFGPDLYSGTSGIALFLGALHRITEDRIFRVTAEGAAAHAVSRISDLPAAGRIGFYSGIAGVAYVLGRLATDLQRPEWSRESMKLASEHWETDSDELDVISGSAGVIPFLLQLSESERDERWLDAARRHGLRLIAAARREEIGWSWDTLTGVSRPLTGFSHGAAGIAWALLELHAATGRAEFHSAATEGFRYEQHWFDPRLDNWPDFREQGKQTNPSFAMAWCHGAPGIGLSRLRAYQLLGEDIYRQQAEAAVRATVLSLGDPASQFASHCLCHGLLGNIELLMMAREVLDMQTHDALVVQVIQRAIDTFERTGVAWPCGVMGGGETPGLMLGTAGVGYFLLSVAERGANASVLMILPRGPRGSTALAGAKRGR